MSTTSDQYIFYYEDDYIAVDYYAKELYFDGEYMAAGYYEGETVLVEFSADFISSASITADGDRIRFGASVQNSEFAQTVIGGVIKQASADFGALFSPSIQINATRAGDIDLYVFYDFAATAARTRDANVTLENIINLSAQNDKILSGASNQNAAFTQTVTANLTQGLESQLAVSFTQNADADRLRGVDSALSTAITQTTDADRIRSSAVDLNSLFVQTANGGYPIEITESYGAEFAISADAIEFIKRDNPYNRPIDFVNGPYTFSTNSYQGTHSLLIDNASLAFTEITESFEIDLEEDFYLRFRFYLESGDTTLFVTRQIVQFNSHTGLIIEQWNPTIDDSGWFVALERDGTQNKLLFGALEGTTIKKAYANGYFASGTWNTIEISRSGNTVTVNGNSTVIGNFAIPAPTDFYQRLFLRNPSNNKNSYFDDFIFLRGVNNGNDIQYSNTVAYYNFDENALDQNTIIHQGNATLNSQFNITGSITGVQGGRATLNSQFIITPDVEKLVEAQSNLNSEFAQIADNTRILEFSAAFSAFNSQLTAINKIGNTLVALDTNSQIDVDGNRIRFGISTLASEVALTASYDVIPSFDEFLVGEFSLTVQPGLLEQGAADFSAIASLTASGITTKIAFEDITSAFTIAVEPLKILQLESNLSAFNSQLTLANITVNPTATLDCNFTISADPIVAKSANAEFGSSFTTFIDGDRLRYATLSVDANFTQTANAVLNAVANSQINAEFTQAVVGDRIRFSNVDLTAFYSQLSAAGIIKQFDFDPVFNFDIAIEVEALKTFDAALSSDVAITVEGDRTRSTSANYSTEIAINITAQSLLSAELSVNSLIDISIAGIKTANAIADLGALFTPAITVTANKVGEIELVAVSSITASGMKIQPFEEFLVADFAISAKLDGFKTTDAALNTEFGIAADLVPIVTERITYIIPREVRIYAIDSERRSYTIFKETRTATVIGE